MRRSLVFVATLALLAGCGGSGGSPSEGEITSTPKQFAGKYPFKDCKTARRGAKSTADSKDMFKARYGDPAKATADKEFLDRLLKGLDQDIAEIHVMFPKCFDQSEVRAGYKRLGLPVPTS